MSCEVIKWVSGNTRPLIKITLKDKNTGDPYDSSTWSVMDLTGKTVSMSFRAKSGGVIIDTLSSVFDSDGTDGKVNFTMGAIAAASTAGNYEGEIVIDHGGPLQTVYDTVDFLFRDSF